MSSDLHLAVVELTVAVRALTTATESLTAALSSGPAPPGSCGSDSVIAIVKDSYEVEESAEVFALVRPRIAEEGPAEFPICLENRAERGLRHLCARPLIRAEAIFRLGFWAHIALATGTPFETEDLPEGAVAAHWVVLRSHFGTPFRVNSFNDLTGLLPIEERLDIVQKFETICELEIFCLGAGLKVPPQWRAESRN